jgi:hypothetical protein
MTPPLRPLVVVGLPLAIPAAALLLPLVVLALGGDAWAPRWDEETDRASCGCSSGAGLALLIAVYTIVLGSELVLGLWLALGPARVVSSKLHFYPWMQQCRAAALVRCCSKSLQYHKVWYRLCES